MHTDEMINITRKRLAWRANHRGIKEMDLLIGGYATKHLPNMSAHELALFETILDIPDQDLLSWATRQQAVPAEHASSLLQAVLTFNPLPTP